MASPQTSLFTTGPTLVTPVLGTPVVGMLRDPDPPGFMVTDEAGAGSLIDRCIWAPSIAPVRQRAMSCVGCGAPLGALSICSYCKREA